MRLFLGDTVSWPDIKGMARGTSMIRVCRYAKKEVCHRPIKCWVYAAGGIRVAAGWMVGHRAMKVSRPATANRDPVQADEVAGAAEVEQ